MTDILRYVPVLRYIKAKEWSPMDGGDDDTRNLPLSSYPSSSHCLGLTTTGPNCVSLAEVITCSSLPKFVWAEGKTGWEWGRSQWPRGLRRGSATARLLGWRVRIPPAARMSVSCDCCVLSGICLCIGLITRPEESYRMWCVCVWPWSLDK